jgi:hypothetical protein
MANRALEVFCLAATVLCDKLEECDEHSSSERDDVVARICRLTNFGD